MKRKIFDKKAIKAAFISTIPVMSGYLVLGIGFGVLLKTKGYGVLWALAMSVCIYAGSMQYVAIDLLAGGASLVVAALTTLTVNARHLFYGISMIDKYKNRGAVKPYLIFALTDETYSLVCNDENCAKIENKTAYYFYVSLFNHIYWVSGSVIGAMLGANLPFSTEGIDFSLTALFVTVFTQQWLETKKHGPAWVGLLVSIVCLLIFGSENFLIPAMVFIVIFLMLLPNKEGYTHE